MKQRGSLLARVHFLQQGSVASDVIDLLRAVAAISVTLFHLRSQLYVGIGEVERATAMTRALYFVTGIGSEWVMVFFVLSGFLIGQSVIRSIRENRWSWPAYLVSRLSRLWMVLLPALLLTAFWDRVGVALFTAGGYGAPALDWKVFVGNLFFLNGILAPQYGTNVPLWSLPYEFWYYMLFPCIVLALAVRRPVQRSVYVALTLLLMLLLPGRIALYFLIWLMGCLLIFLPHVQFRGAWPGKAIAVSAASGAFLAAMAASKLGLFHSEFIAYLLVGVTFTALLYLLLSALSDAPARPGATWARAARFLAGFSYTLYLTHFPVRNLLIALRNHVGMAPWRPSPGYVLLGCAVAAGVSGYAWCVSRVTEAKTDAVRRLFMRMAGAVSGR